MDPDDLPDSKSRRYTIQSSAYNRGYYDGFAGNLPAFGELLNGVGKVRPSSHEYLRGYRSGTKDNPNPLDPAKLC